MVPKHFLLWPLNKHTRATDIIVILTWLEQICSSGRSVTFPVLTACWGRARVLDEVFGAGELLEDPHIQVSEHSCQPCFFSTLAVGF